MDEVKRECTSDERSPVIDPELRDLLPPITDEEREALTADILKNGCYSPHNLYGGHDAGGRSSPI